MEEIWIETKIWFNQRIHENKDDYNTLLLEIYKPIVSELEAKDYFVTFHFFFEPDPNALFRVRVKNKEDMNEAEQIIERILSNKDLIKKFEFNREYEGEKPVYKEGWDIAQKFFEISCRFALSRIDNSFEKGKEYTDEKLVHCFCNQVHVSYPKEIEFYLKRLQHLGVKTERKCKMCGDDKIHAEIKTPYEERFYCHECFLSVQQAENLLHDHATRMFLKRRK